MPRSVRALLPLAACAVALAGCGGKGSSAPDAGGSAGSSQGTPQQPSQSQEADPLALPASVPVTADGPANQAQERVIRGWLQAVRAGRIAAAAAYWAVPAIVQNGSPVLELASRADVRAFNNALPCGAVLTKAGSARGGFTITTVRLTDRKGGACGGVGARVRTAIRVRGGRIVEWYALPDTAVAVPQAQAPTV